jgi:hypothetical protein
LDGEQMYFEMEISCGNCHTHKVEHLGADEETNQPIFVCNKCGEQGSFDKFLYLEIKGDE